jgi:hypothetical protein
MTIVGDPQQDFEVTKIRESKASWPIRAATRQLGGYEFWHVGSLQVRRTAEGLVDEYTHQLGPRIRTNAHGAGPFCYLGLPAAPAAAGVYALFVAGELRYIGECQDLAERFGPRGYSQIHPRNCHHDGQGTNCKINARVLAAAKIGLKARVWFCPSAERSIHESELISHFSPPWNGRGASTTQQVGEAASLSREVPQKRTRSTSRAPQKKDFQKALTNLLEEAQSRGEASIQIRAGDLHIQVGSYPGRDHRMPSCCSAMRSLRASGDSFIYRPPCGDGARLTIEYRLPRPAHHTRISF